MKKTLFTIALAGLAACSLQAQGLVIFSSSTQNMSTNNGVSSGKTLGAGNFYYALFQSVAATTVAGNGSTAVQGLNASSVLTDGNWSLVGYAASTATAGRFAATAPNGDGSTTVGVTGGNAEQFVVIGWSVNLGQTISALQTALATGGTTGFLGQSVVSGSITTGNGALLPTPNTFQASAPQMQAFTLGSFTVASTPEPGTMVLAGLGGLALLGLRRKK